MSYSQLLQESAKVYSQLLTESYSGISLPRKKTANTTKAVTRTKIVRRFLSIKLYETLLYQSTGLPVNLPNDR